MKRTGILAFASMFVLCASGLQGQQHGPFASVDPQVAVAIYPAYPASSSAVTSPAINSESVTAVPDTAPQGQTASAGTTPPATDDDHWHFSVSPYFWIAGVHGATGAFGRSVGFKASPSDLLEKFRFGLAGVVEARHKRVLVPIDLLWLRLQDDKGIPYPPALSATSATIKGTVFLLTPKVGFRVVDSKMIKADALAGIRFWYFGESLQFNPSLLGLNFSRSQDWVDPVVGGRVTGVLTPKVAATLAGDVGGWGTGSQLEYQAVGILGYKVSPKTTLQAGYRYLNVDKTKGGVAGAFVNLTMAGAFVGVTFDLK